MTGRKEADQVCHCEERSDEAISGGGGDCFAEPVLSTARFFGRLRSPEGRLRRHRPQNDTRRRAQNDRERRARSDRGRFSERLTK